MEQVALYLIYLLVFILHQFVCLSISCVVLWKLLKLRWLPLPFLVLLVRHHCLIFAAIYIYIYDSCFSTNIPLYTVDTRDAQSVAIGKHNGKLRGIEVRSRICERRLAAVYLSCPVVPCFPFLGWKFPFKTTNQKKVPFFPMATGHLRYK